jgi:putative membrane protein
MMGGHGFGLFGMAFGGLMMLVFWGGVIVLGFFAFRALSRSGNGGAGAASNRSNSPAVGSVDRALDILRERYARGEITKEEFDNMRRDLAV